jgi:hypothetical protein
MVIDRRKFIQGLLASSAAIAAIDLSKVVTSQIRYDWMTFDLEVIKVNAPIRRLNQPLPYPGVSLVWKRFDSRDGTWGNNG